MLTEQEKGEILHEARLYPHLKAACLDALKIVQRHRGWVNDENIEDIAELLYMSADEVDGVATFYSRIYRKPVGRNVILICDSVSCMVMDYQSIYDHIYNRLGIRFGETTTDGRFTVLPISCLGDCDHAPAIMINDDLYHNLNASDLGELLEKYK